MSRSYEPRKRYKPEKGKAKRHAEAIKRVAKKVKKKAKDLWFKPAKRSGISRDPGMRVYREKPSTEYLKGVRME